MAFLYAILIPVKKALSIEVGVLGRLEFRKGCYVYVGSANSGLWRIRRHFRKEKALKWHIDYLTVRARPEKAYAGHFPDECQLARRIAEAGEMVHKGFGSSDTSCFSHLIYFMDCRKARQVLGSMSFMRIIEGD